MRARAAVRRALRNLPIPPGQVIGIAVALGLARIVPLIPPGRRAISRAAGMAAIGAGAGLNLWALRERARHADGSFDLEHPDTLVTSGPYARSRHPMYVGWWLIHAGIGWSAGSAWVLVTLPTAALVEHPFVLAEERRLVLEFRAQGERYVARVPRYLPTLRGRRMRARPIHSERRSRSVRRMRYVPPVGLEDAFYAHQQSSRWLSEPFETVLPVQKHTKTPEPRGSGVSDVLRRHNSVRRGT